MKIEPINTTPDGCAFTIVTRYEARAYLKGMTSGGGYDMPHDNGCEHRDLRV